MAGEIKGEVLSEKVVNLDKLRSLVKRYVEKHQYESALFWADKLVSLSRGEVQDIYWHAQCLYLTGQHHRAAHVLQENKLDKRFLACRHLAARCHFDSKELQEALDILDQNTSSSIVGPKSSSAKPQEETHPDIPHTNMESAINLLRGKVYESMDNRNLAAECFREALRADVYCYEAFDTLVNHHMMTSQEERELLESLPFSKQCPEEEIELLKFLYENKLKKYNKPGELAIPNTLEQLNENIDTVVSIAERHYYNCDFRQCYKVTTGVLKRDPFNSQCLPLHVAVLVELSKNNELFYLAHKLVDMYPSKAVAWFAVGCYYLLVGKNDPARRYLSKATTLDRVYGPAWLAFGHSFAAENEHDQAMAAYFTASQLMKGCHLPILYIGLEYGLTNNAKLAERFFSQALTIAPEDPFVLHEIGVVAFWNQDYGQADAYFRSALDKVQAIGYDVMVDKWEALLNNLGHVCRKLQKYDEALEYHRQALILCPQNPSTLSAMGYAHLLNGNSAEAVDYFHKALGLRRDDTFSTTMLDYAIEQLMSEMTPCDGVPEVLPPYTYEGHLDTGSTSDKVSLTPLDDTEPSSINIEADSTLGDSSCMALDADMEDV